MRLCVSWIGLLLIFFQLAEPAGAVVLTTRTAAGDTVFFAPEGDTVTVVVDLDSEGAAVTGVEVFLGYDPRYFEALSAGMPQAGEAGLVGDALVNTVLFLADSLALVHYAEADLAGKGVAGRLFSLGFRVLGTVPNGTPIGVFQDAARKLVSAYTFPDVDGRTIPFGNVTPVVYRNFPPVLHLPEALEVVEDEALAVDLRPLASDVESTPERLAWQVTGADTLVGISWGEDPFEVTLQPAADFYGTVPLSFSVSDPAGNTRTQVVVLQVLPNNDPPEILAGVLPDTLVLAEPVYRLPLDAAARDVDDGLETLVWQAESDEPVQVAIQAGVAVITTPVNWRGTAWIRFRVLDDEGASDAVSLLGVREGPLNTLPGDLDGDGRVTFPDFLAFARAFGSSDPPDAADLDGDGRVDFSDFLVLARNFGRAAD